jgi:hypothetical protein
MKLHDNSWFGGRLIVRGTSPDFLKTHVLIELTGRIVTFPNLQEQVTRRLIDQRFHECGGHAATPKFRAHREIENLAFAHGRSTRHQKTCHAIFADRDPEIVLQVLVDVPLGGFRRRGLNGSYRRAEFLAY